MAFSGIVPAGDAEADDRRPDPGGLGRRTTSPSSLLYYPDIQGDRGDLPHHTLFFDQDLEAPLDAVCARPAS